MLLELALVLDVLADYGHPLLGREGQSKCGRGPQAASQAHTPLPPPPHNSQGAQQQPRALPPEQGALLVAVPPGLVPLVAGAWPPLLWWLEPGMLNTLAIEWKEGGGGNKPLGVGGGLERIQPSMHTEGMALLRAQEGKAFKMSSLIRGTSRPEER